MRGLRSGKEGLAAALIALLMLSYAFAQSNVMRMTMAAAVAQPARGGLSESPMAAMAGMEGMAAKPSAASPSKPHAPAKACPYCAAAAHLPTLATATPWRAPSTFVFTAFRVVASHGPRGPPALQPRARGPPIRLLTL